MIVFLNFILIHIDKVWIRLYYTFKDNSYKYSMNTRKGKDNMKKLIFLLIIPMDEERMCS